MAVVGSHGWLMLFSWLKNRRRRQLLATPFPAGWLEYLRRNFAEYARLSAAEQRKLCDDLRIFIVEKNWEGCGGLEMTDEIKVTIAAQACLLVLGMGPHCYDRLQSILVYPTGYQAPGERAVRGGLVLEGSEPRLGEAWYRGPVVLSWEDVLEGARYPGEGANVVFHEFAHQLDMLDGAVDGTPPLKNREQYQRWQKVMTPEYRRLVAAAQEGWDTFLDPYGATNEGEFFAVVTESFFDQPVELRRYHPRLYEVLREYYRQDPAARHEKG